MIKERNFAKELCYEYNILKPNNKNEKKLILEKLFGKIGEKFLIEPNFWCDYGYNIFVGENFYMNHNCVLLDCAKIEFGDK